MKTPEERRESQREASRRWRASHPEQIAAANTRWRAEHPEAVKAIRDRGRANHLEERRAKESAYGRSEAGRERNRRADAKRRAEPEYRARHRAIVDAYGSKPANALRFAAIKRIRLAQANGWPFSPELPEVLALNPPTDCACCGRALNYERGRSEPGRDASPSLDRRDPDAGYTVENVGIICLGCNRLKGGATVHQVKQLLRYMVGELIRDGLLRL